MPLLAGLPPMDTVGQLRAVLGIPSTKRLGYYLLAQGPGGPRPLAASLKRRPPYRVKEIPKRSGGTRLLCAPAAPLKACQRALLRLVLDKVPAHPAAHGFVRGRSTVSNATPHAGAAVVLKFDVEDFFPTVTFRRAVGLFEGLGYPAGGYRVAADDAATCVAPVLARLCCFQPASGGWVAAHLAQGAPTSPAVANLVCRRLDARLERLAGRYGGVYTRYADDLTVSFRTPAHPPPPVVARWVGRVLRAEGFTPNAKKFRVFRAAQRQEVTGLVVNAGARVPREARRRVRAMLHDAETAGVAAASSGDPRWLDKLGGWCAYLCAADPARGRPLVERVKKLRSATP